MIIKIVHIITKLELGGAQQNTLYTVCHLDRKKFDAYLISGEEGLLDAEARELMRERFYTIPEMVREIRPIKDIRALLRLVKTLKRIRSLEPGDAPLIVHTHSSKAGILGRIAAWIARCDAIIHTYHGFGFHDWQKPPVKWAFIMAERIIKPITDAFICVSRSNIEKGVKHKVLREHDTGLIRSGIDISLFSPSPSKDRSTIRASIDVEGDRPLVGMVACFKPQKNPLAFVEMASIVSKECPEAVFAIAGDGVLRRQIENKISQLGLKDKVKLLGWRRDVPELMAGFDILTLTSLWEGLPRVIPQAFAAHLAVVATNVDGSGEVIKHGVNGYITEPEDVQGMAEYVIKLIKSPEARKQMGRAGAETVKEFDIDLMVKQQQDLYCSLVPVFDPEAQTRREAHL